MTTKLPVTLFALSFLALLPPFTGGAQADGCLPSATVLGTSSCPISCFGFEPISIGATGFGTISASCGGSGCSASGPNPSCSFTTRTSGTGTCSWSGTGTAHCNTG